MTQDKLLKIIYWIFLLGLCGLSAEFTWEVFELFSSKDTSFKVYEESIFEHPTVTICFSNNKEYDYGTDFNLTHGHMYVKEGIFMYENIILFEGKNYFNNSKELIYLDKLITHKSGFCYRIIPTTQIIYKGEMKSIQVYFNNTIQSEGLPSLKIYFTSEKNSYGIVLNSWLNGDPMEETVDKYTYKVFSLKPEKYMYLNTSKSICSFQSYWDCYATKVHLKLPFQTNLFCM